RGIIYYTSKHEEKAKAPVSMMKILVILAGLCVFIGTTTTLWMENIIVPAGSVLVDKGTVSVIPFLEYSTLLSTGGLLVLATIPVGIAALPLLNKIRAVNLEGILTEITLTDAVRYMLLGQAIVISLIFLF
ncbi:MAG: hypothetical protein KGY76_08435, partial [Candidatus Thermoplasmatota archaeon]|nr:hypothetical protein [Candidatus Thermoplasmatota archaeon]